MKEKKLIIGVTGTLAAGKDTIAFYICEKYGAKSYSTSDEIRRENNLRNLDNSRDNMVKTGNELRESFGTGELAKRVLGRVNDNMAVSTGIRNVGEINYFRDNSYFYLITVDAPIELRYERARLRDRAGDGKTLEEFRTSEEREMNTNSIGQQLVPCMRMADYFIVNDGTEEMLHQRVEEILKAIKTRFEEEHTVIL